MKAPHRKSNWRLILFFIHDGDRMQANRPERLSEETPMKTFSEKWNVFLTGCWILAWVFLVLGCTAADPGGKRTFVGSGEDPPAAWPDGLNPLGTLETCTPQQSRPVEGIRVLISRPEQFTREASVMIVFLRESLAENEETRKQVELMLSSTPIHSTAEAVQTGKQCHAMIVLWERLGSRTLELTLPQPSRVPLRAMVQDKLCEFGDHAEQLTILDLTIRGLAAVDSNNFEKANGYFLSANRLDDRCFHLPLAKPDNLSHMERDNR